MNSGCFLQKYIMLCLQCMYFFSNLFYNNFVYYVFTVNSIF
nr:MAG TPA: hypothetical protein [Caudoviricetes sp.]